uniref:Protein kinase domain-containing protein n=1 Tax=Macrostomum lignano TaxID=282301 RepID=A0A1I8GJW7_9PLAT
MSMSKDSNESPLSFEISRFYADRDRLNKLLDQTESLLDKDFVKVLSPELVAEIRENLALQGVRERVNQLFKSGGGFNSRKFVDQSSTPCTARVTRITYADRVTVRLLDKHGKQLGQTVQPEDGKIDENLIWLKDDSREDANLLSASVELGVPSEFLRKCGLDIVDSPGLNENDALDTLTMRAIDSFLPIILYVIDGRYGITLAAEKDIENIRATAPELELFYLVTKMDVSKEDIPTPESGRTIEDIEQDRARRVFSRLKKLQCFGAEETPESCSRFFCISSWEMKNYRRRVAIAIKRSGGDQAAGAAVKRSKWVLRFNEMQQKLADFAAEQFRSLILGACSGLRVLHCQTMDLVMNKANDIRACTQMRRKNLEMIRAMECRNHEQSKKIVEKHREGFEREAESLIKSQGPILLEEVKSMEYSENVIDANLSSNQIEERCVTEIHRFINNRVIVAYQEFLQKGAMQDCFAELEDLKARVFEYERDIEQTPSLAVLKATLADECDLQASDIYSLGFRTVMRQMSLNIRTILRHPGVIFSRPVQDPEWKRFQAKCHISRLVECLVDSMNKWLDKRHFRFLQKIRCSEQLVENSASLSELERQRIVQLAPRLAFMYTRCLDVATGYQFRGYTIDKRAQLGSGAQGTVYAVRDTQGEVAMAAKVVNVESQSLGNISSEVFYS